MDGNPYLAVGTDWSPDDGEIEWRGPAVIEQEASGFVQKPSKGKQDRQNEVEHDERAEATRHEPRNN